jgi:hypothetical protein
MLDTKLAAEILESVVVVNHICGWPHLPFPDPIKRQRQPLSSCFLIWLETVRDQPVPTLPMQTRSFPSRLPRYGAATPLGSLTKPMPIFAKGHSRGSMS